MAKLDDPENILGTYNRVNEFDHNQKDRIKNLILLNGLCEFNHSIILQNYDLGEEGEVASFFTTIVDIANIVLTWEINDEISASLFDRGPIKELLLEVNNNVINDLREINSERWNYGCSVAIHNLTNTFNGEYTDRLKGSIFLDFIVSTYSAFEYWLCKIYDNLFDSNEVLNSRKKDICKAIFKKINIEENIKIELSNEIVNKYSNYVTSRTKIDKVVSMARKKSKNITDRDLELVTFYSALRNSIHNLGYHSKTIDVIFYDIKIEEGKASYYSDYSKNIKLCMDLCKLYCSIINSLDLKVNSLINLK